MAPPASICGVVPPAPLPQLSRMSHDGGAMAADDAVIVDLALVRRSLDLWASLEAAQYARVLARDEVTGAHQTAAADRLDALLTQETEGWEDRPESARVAALAALEEPLRQLRAFGLRLHAGVAHCRFVTAEGIQTLPVAVLHVSGRDAASVQVSLPAFPAAGDG